MDNWYVQIIEHATDVVVEEMGPFTERKADKVDDGANINLDHERFYTNMIERP